MSLTHTPTNSSTAPLRIGILGTRGIPNRYGGFEECAEKLALGLVKKGHQVSVYNSHRHEYKGPDWRGVRIIHCKDPEDRLGTAGQFIYDLNCINDARNRAFDVALHLGYTSSSVWWWRWPRKSVNLVNMDGLEWKRSKYSRKVQIFLKKAEALAARHADGLIADSKGIQEYLLANYNRHSYYIPYGAIIYEDHDVSFLSQYGLQAYGYHLLIARMEPENNIELIIEGYLQSRDTRPLIVIGGLNTDFGKRLAHEHDRKNGVRFLGGVYNAAVINSLRYFSHLYYHGHSVGGTNPSLLEAMGCSALIVAHRNIFNEAILGGDAFYFSNPTDIAEVIRHCGSKDAHIHYLSANREKIRNTYNWPAVVDAYEQMMLEYVGNKGELTVVATSQPLP